MNLILEEYVIRKEIWEGFMPSLEHESTKEIYFGDLIEAYSVMQVEFSKAGKDEARTYYGYLKQRTLGKEIRPSTAVRKIKELSSISSYIEKNREIFGVPAYENPFKMYSGILKNELGDGERCTVIEAGMILDASKGDKLAYTVIYLSYNARLSSSDVISLMTEDVSFNEDSSIAEIYGKRIKIPPLAASYCRDVIKNGEGEHFFRNRTGNPLNYMYLSRMIKKYCERAGVGPYTFNQFSAG